MQTGIKRDFKVGDLVFTGAFPAIIISDVRTSTPCCEVFGFEQECGSVYATDLKPLPKDDWLRLAAANGHGAPFRVWSDKSLKALQALGIPVEKLG